MDQSGDDTCQFLPRGMPRRLKFDVDQSAIDTCHMCHVAVRPTPVGPSTGVVGTHPSTHPPTTHHLPGCFWAVPRVFGSSTGVLGSSRDVRGCSGCVWEVPGVFGKCPGCFGEVPVRFRKFPGVLESCRVLGPKKHVLRSFRSKAKTRNFRPMFHAEPAVIRS